MEPDQEPNKKKRGRPPGKKSEKMLGRPTKLDPAIVASICEKLMKGATRGDAAVLSGITYQTLLNWYQAGEDAGEGDFFDFFVAVQKAEAIPIQTATDTVMKALATNPKIAIEFLKRRSLEWRDKIRVEDLSDEQILRILDNS